MMRTSVHQLIRDSAHSRGQSPALSHKEQTLTYAELWAAVCGAAAGLRGLGLRREDRVAVFLDKRPETVVSLFGASAAGGVFVPLNPVLRAQQVAYILADCAVRFLVTTPERFALLEEELPGLHALEHVVLLGADPGPAPGAAHQPRISWWDGAFPGSEGAAAETVPARVIDDDLAAILYTSGSTGSPKGVVLSHRNLVVGAESVSEYLANTADDVILSALPLSFDAGFSQLTTAFAVGAHVVLMNYLLPMDVVRLCAKHGVTGLTCVPPLWIQIAELAWPGEVAEKLRYFANTGGRMPKSTLDILRGVFTRARPFLMYGLTEAFRSTYLDPDEVDRRPDSIGKAIPNAEVLVLRQDGTECAVGEQGELVHRGALVAQGYWNDSVRTAARFRPLPAPHDGWRRPELAVWSGDLVVRDEDGFLYFVGRGDDMIKTSGYRVSPSEIEEVAYQSTLVRDAVALGVEDARLGQRVLLIVSPGAGGAVDADALLGFLRHRLPSYMVPSRIEVLSEIPRSPNGKFDRALLKQGVMTA